LIEIQRTTTVFAKQGQEIGNPTSSSLIGCIGLDDIVLKEITLEQAIKILMGIATKLMNTNALASQIRQR
jgi:hypothetical protein